MIKLVGAAGFEPTTTTPPEVRPGNELLDHFNVSLLEEDLYHADGQIDGEVYVYGSFLQSKMFEAGVTCSDCHNPHSLELKVQGNALCGQCHLNDKYNTQEHSLHEVSSIGAQCVSCHMQDKTYMGVDDRGDHSFRIPRPDLTVDLGTPNACNDCHQDQSPQWAAEVLEEEFGTNFLPHYAYALAAGRQGLPAGESLLSQLVLDTSQPAIVRATTVSLLPQYFSQQSASILQLAAQGSEPLIGLGLAGVLQTIPETYRGAFAVPLLYDNSQVTRGLAARSMTGISLDVFPEETGLRFEAAISEYMISEEFNSDRPESLVNVAGMYSATGNREEAERFYLQAIDLAPWFTPAYINFSDHHRRNADEPASIALLEQALDKVRDTATVQHALGLAQVRAGRTEEALEYLRLAAESEQVSDRYDFVYAIALNSTGRWQEALVVLEEAQQDFPLSLEIISALVSINRDNGQEERARFFEGQLPPQ